PFANLLDVHGLVVKHASVAYLGQIAGEFVVERAVFSAPEIDVACRAQYPQVIAISVVAVIAYAAITGDAAIHFVFEERPQILIDVGTLLAAETALGMAR